MANTCASRKQKGRSLQQYVRDKILQVFDSLTDRDVVSTPMGVSGTDIQLSSAAFELIPWCIETKNQEHLSIWEALKQSDSKNRQGAPLLVFKRNRSEVYCALKFNDFMKLLEQIKDLSEELNHKYEQDAGESL